MFPSDRTKLVTHIAYLSLFLIILAVGTSAGGARAKAVVNINPATGELTPVQLPVPGTESWLLKFDGVGADKQLGSGESFGRIEYAYSLMARAAGIDFPETRL